MVILLFIFTSFLFRHSVENYIEFRSQWNFRNLAQKHQVCIIKHTKMQRPRSLCTPSHLPLETWHLVPKLQKNYIVPNLLWCCRHILEKFMQSSPSSDDTSFIRICLLANRLKIITVTPIKGDLDHLLLDTVYVLFLSDLHLTLLKNDKYCLCSFY